MISEERMTENFAKTDEIQALARQVQTAAEPQLLREPPGPLHTRCGFSLAVFICLCALQERLSFHLPLALKFVMGT